ncbi:MAG: hypothetical protein ABI478_08920 [Propionivibrio sp.]
MQAIEREVDGGQIMVSSIAAWELSMLVAKGRVALSIDVAEWLSLIGQSGSVCFVPVDNEIAVKALSFPANFTTIRPIESSWRRRESWPYPVVSADEKIRAYLHVRTIW